MFFFFKQKTAYEMLSGDWSSDVCSSDLITMRFDGEEEEAGNRVTLSSLHSAKGLEFDYVFLPDVDAATYPSDDESRRALYLALTRTCAAVSVAWVGRASPMIRNIAHHRGGESRAAPR